MLPMYQYILLTYQLLYQRNDIKKISDVQLCIYDFYIISNIIFNVMNESTVGT